ncbi:Polynucleotidyl transferase- ribonuclease H-like superfamily protein [Striga hermonthica]|uniref:Polynucleotidyl transferase- ribonuclease H-like superfamily protein n=1 Tax=Striga hermonthica TaxID=68872 RepID=A0A9N7P1C1_STRHE|nr:Polynucleotidyl transferase- ribonuclease H-like superfamily protein [Striga hermonthica]
MERVRRHLSEVAACGFCGKAESLSHVLRDCDMARKLWLELVPISCRPSFFSQDICTWFWSNVVEDANVGIENWEIIFPIACWRLWAWRNMAIFSNKVFPLEAKIMDINRRVDTQLRSLDITLLPAAIRFRKFGFIPRVESHELPKYVQLCGVPLLGEAASTGDDSCLSRMPLELKS